MGSRGAKHQVWGGKVPLCVSTLLVKLTIDSRWQFPRHRKCTQDGFMCFVPTILDAVQVTGTEQWQTSLYELFEVESCRSSC